MATSTLLHRQVTVYLRERIESGVIQPSSRMPSERVLAEQFAVSRVTIRQAMRDLEAQGLVEVIGGVRWVRKHTESSVARRSSHSLEEGATGLVSFSDLAAANGLTVSATILTMQTRPGSLDEADLLSVAPGAPIVDLVRIRYLDSIPILMDFTLIPEALAPGLGAVDLSHGSLYHTLADSYGLHAVRAQCAIEARGASPEIADGLGLAPGDPVLEIIQTIYDQNDRVMQWGRSVYRGDRYRFRADLEGTQRPSRAGTTADEPTGRGFRADKARVRN
ncbi:GntR family transcriptional regulator [Mycetocola spongiae]|uniref:GntR family transcriptional regulator n=1 Tax=Mycetocola spongiae TaxID=2859226 RepID=UPI001CF2BEC7|nr:GntR family transcriptional regulator [Mycetocola spongiae]UCR88064.1 GntR family transcriptional regulator [Mycetocola spongiae]